MMQYELSAESLFSLIKGNSLDDAIWIDRGSTWGRRMRVMKWFAVTWLQVHRKCFVFWHFSKGQKSTNLKWIFGFFLIVTNSSYGIGNNVSKFHSENCARGTHLKFMRHPHNDDSALSERGWHLIISRWSYVKYGYFI